MNNISNRPLYTSLKEQKILSFHPKNHLKNRKYREHARKILSYERYKKVLISPSNNFVANLHTLKSESSTSLFVRYKDKINFLNILHSDISQTLNKLERLELCHFDNKHLFTVISKAKRLILNTYFYIEASNLWWSKPLLNVTDDEEIIFEWWHKKRKLTIYVCFDSIDFIKVWGPHMDNEMEDGFIDESFNDLSVWNWISQQ